MESTNRNLPAILRKTSRRTIILLATLWLIMAPAAADIVLYTVPGLPLTFLIEGRTTANPGKTLTLRHPLGTLYLGLEDVKVFKVASPRSIASDKLNRAVSKGDVDSCLAAAKWALHNGLLPKFYEGLSAAWKIDSTNPTVRRLSVMRQRLNARLNPPSREQQELKTFARDRAGMKFAYSKHFILMHDTEDRPARGSRQTRAQQRLALLETVYESFLMKFAMEGYELQVPKEYLKVVLFSEHQDYLQFVNLLGPSLKSTAGFYDRKANISVFYDQGTHASFEALDELNRLLQRRKDEAVRERGPGTRELVRFADTIQLLSALSSANQDIEVVTHEATHHMAGNTGLMPGDCPMPVWAAEGLATYFESPKEAAWSGIGAVNEQRLDWYKVLARDTRHSNIEFIVTDKIFSLAISSEGQLHGYGQAWALTHFLMNRHFGKLMRWYSLVAQRKQDKNLTPDQLLSSFRFVFGDMVALEHEWRAYMRTLRTDIDIVLSEAGAR